MRLDRMLCLTAGKYLRPASKIRIPILMYHSVSEEQKPVKHPYFSTTVTTAVFKAHLNFLKEHNYKIINLNQISGYLKQDVNEQKLAVITFDDGYRDFYENAFPLLQEFGFTATVFVPSGIISENGISMLEGQVLMNWQQIRECQANNIEVGSHSLTHGVLVNGTRQSLETELKESKKILEQKLNTSITSFAYPYCFPAENKEFVLLLKEILLDSDYKTGVTTSIGLATEKSDNLILSRIPVNDFDDLQLFSAKLNGYYDFLYLLQILFKKIKNIIR